VTALQIEDSQEADERALDQGNRVQRSRTVAPMSAHPDDVGAPEGDGPVRRDRDEIDTPRLSLMA
jgi:hypothetical protein